jgi:hypothetical protein
LFSGASTAGASTAGAAAWSCRCVAAADRGRGAFCRTGAAIAGDAGAAASSCRCVAAADRGRGAFCRTGAAIAGDAGASTGGRVADAARDGFFSMGAAGGGGAGGVGVSLVREVFFATAGAATGAGESFLRGVFFPTAETTTDSGASVARGVVTVVRGIFLPAPGAATGAGFFFEGAIAAAFAARPDLVPGPVDAAGWVALEAFFRPGLTAAVRSAGDPVDLAARVGLLGPAASAGGAGTSTTGLDGTRVRRAFGDVVCPLETTA